MCYIINLLVVSRVRFSDSTIFLCYTYLRGGFLK
nr:MAG TPA_asm: hypothetical protein [Caudoviricetes sp.]